jgi:hypothetical protein
VDGKLDEVLAAQVQQDKEDEWFDESDAGSDAGPLQEPNAAYDY